MNRSRRDRAADLERLHVEILPQPDDFTCGPTCLHAVAGFEDAVLGEELYLRVVRTFLARVAHRHSGWGVS
ncbi:MAG TPA: hypothetical protein VK348_15575 [Planctomycetota bacterium]|nr:hypothetical protein [Planctomycetota bacterium]